MKTKSNYQYVRKVNNLAEALIALGEGLTLSSDNCEQFRFKLKEGKLVKGVHEINYLSPIDSIYSGDFTEVAAYKEAGWRETIPEGGILCWLDDTAREPTKEHFCNVVLRWENNRFVCGNDAHWRYAKPLTKQELQTFLNNCPEN